MRKCTKCEVIYDKPEEHFYKRQDNHNKLRTVCKKCISENRKKWRQDKKDHLNQYQIKWNKENRESINKYKKHRYETDMDFRLRQCLSGRLRDYVKIENKSLTEYSRELIGCSIEFLKQYLEKQFTKGMSWDNYGNPNGDHTNCWHIDHIKPCVSFDLTQENQQKECFHYTNLQPLWAKDNISKGAKIL